MDKKELQVIMELMEELQGSMDHSEDDFMERLGRKKPDVEVVKIEGALGEDPSIEMDDDSELEDELEEDGSEESGYDPEISMEDEMSPEESLKKRIMKMRG